MYMVGQARSDGGDQVLVNCTVHRTAAAHDLSPLTQRRRRELPRVAPEEQAQAVDCLLRRLLDGVPALKMQPSLPPSAGTRALSTRNIRKRKEATAAPISCCFLPSARPGLRTTYAKTAARGDPLRPHASFRVRDGGDYWRHRPRSLLHFLAEAEGSALAFATPAALASRAFRFSFRIAASLLSSVAT